MKTRSFQKKLAVVALILLAMIVLAIGIRIAWLWTSLPRDIVRENITIEEAQRLVSFPICMPAYIPPEINPEPQIIYHADEANVPQVTYIRLRYQHVDTREAAFEVYQKYTDDETIMETVHPEPGRQREKAIVNLLYWMFPKTLAESEIESAMRYIQLDASSFQSNQTVWWLYEITDPSEYRSTMTEWIKDHVDYSILSYLPAEEIEKVTLSMLECSNP